MIAFESREEVQAADRNAADILKEMFRHHLPKVEDLGEGQDDEAGDGGRDDAEMAAVPGEDGRLRKQSSKGREI